MKKILFFLTLMVVAASLIGCNSSGGRTLDFRSIACTETGATLALGDRKAVFDAIFDEGEDLGHGLYRYLDGALEVSFENNRAAGFQFNTYPSTDRITFYHVDLDMTLEDVFENFTPSEFAGDNGGLFNRFFDARGNEVPQEESDYTLTVACFDPFGIIYVVLHRNT